MQSSTAIALRALVMLICMISIPLFAIFGRDLPEVIKNLLAGRLVIRVTDAAPGNGAAAAGTATNSAAGNLPSRTNSPFSEPAPYRAEGDTEGPGRPQSAAGAGHVGAATAGNWRANEGSQATAQPAGFQVASESRQISPTSDANGAAAPSGGGAFAPPANDPPRAASSAVSEAPAAPVGAGTGDEQFRRAEARLRELGATHYTLETWGSENNRYRFVCKMAIGSSPGVNRYFQAIEDDPWRAMNAVLQQVEVWRSQQQP